MFALGERLRRVLTVRGAIPEVVSRSKQVRSNYH